LAIELLGRAMDGQIDLTGPGYDDRGALTKYGLRRPRPAGVEHSIMVPGDSFKKAAKKQTARKSGPLNGYRRCRSAIRGTLNPALH
jgi:hypothetical protein